MAAASSSPFTLTFLCLYCSLVVCVHFPSASSLNFSLDFSKTGDPCGRELVCKGDASFRSTMIELTRNDGVNPSSWSRGMVWYATPVPLWNAVTAEVASFTSTFSFNITRVEGSTEWADGMAFFLSSYARDNSVLDNTYSAGLLGLFKQYYYQDVTGDSRVVAVEFDTIRNLEYWDSSSQHVGIDVNSIKSVSYTNTTSPDKNLTSGFTMTATVRYNNGSKLLAVDLRIDDTLYHVNATVDLKKELPEEVAIGFSATTGLFYELHGVLSWSFNSSLEAGQVPPPVKPGPSEKLLLKVLIPVASVSVFAIVCLLLWLWRKPRRNFKPIEDGNDSESDEQQGEADFERGVAGPRRYSYRELAAATGDFAEDNMLGRGGFGSVYKGCLPNDIEDGQLVAIKKFSSESSQSRKEFEAEVKIIGRLRHRNLVQLLGWCDSRKGLLLVYELVPEGSLDKHIYDSQRVLTWAERYNIIVGLGSALCYLHRDWEQCVVHGDIKPSNIMLDSAYNGKLGDFGLARLGDHGSGPKTTIVKGTMGYIDPEFVNTSRRSTQSDVYSFGIVLLEIVSGRPPVNRFDPSFMLMKWVWNHYSQGKILDAADERLRTNDKATERQMERALVVGLWCTLRDPEQRPWVGDALLILQSEDRLPDLPLQMYKMAAAPLSFGAGESGASGSSFSSGVRSLDITGTTRSSESSINRSDL